MKILVFSLGVVFREGVQGGSQKVLRDIAIGLAKRGHSITIICPKRQDNNTVFNIEERVTVKPILPLKGAFPMPYAVSPFFLSEAYRIMESELMQADLLYCHDGGLNIGLLKNRIPTVISLRDFCYPETLLGALDFREDALIVNSMHSYLCLNDSFADVNPFIEDNVSVIGTILHDHNFDNLAAYNGNSDEFFIEMQYYYPNVYF